MKKYIIRYHISGSLMVDAEDRGDAFQIFCDTPNEELAKNIREDWGFTMHEIEEVVE